MSGRTNTADSGKTSPGKECVLLNHGEVFLKGRNRHRFVDRLHDNLRTSLRGVGGSTWIKVVSNVTVIGGDAPQEELVERARRVIGFSSVVPALRVPSSMTDIVATALESLPGAAGERESVSFAVRARRSDKNFPLRSVDVEAQVGARIKDALGWPVNLSHPELTLSIVIGKRETYLSWARHPGLGGLPVGTSGRALVLLSGGFDSPVAAHRAMRRGLRCDFVHFTGAPYTNANSTYKAYALARELNRYQPPGALHVIALGNAQKQLALAGAGKLQIVAQRRLMARTASVLARRTRAEALVTGDSLGQVASQTLANLTALDKATDLPILRPLLGWEKQEIIDEAKSLGTAAISTLPDEDCCRLLAPPRVALRAGLAELRAVEGRLDLDEVVAALLDTAQIMRPGSPTAAPEPHGPASGQR